jgi:hypothetical protein
LHFTSRYLIVFSDKIDARSIERYLGRVIQLANAAEYRTSLATRNAARPAKREPDRSLLFLGKLAVALIPRNDQGLAKFTKSIRSRNIVALHNPIRVVPVEAVAPLMEKPPSPLPFSLLALRLPLQRRRVSENIYKPKRVYRLMRTNTRKKRHAKESQGNRPSYGRSRAIQITTNRYLIHKHHSAILRVGLLSLILTIYSIDFLPSIFFSFIIIVLKFN